MAAKLYLNGDDITYEVLSYKRTQDLCSGLGDLLFSVHGDSANTYTQGSTMTVEEDSILKGTFYVSTINRSVPNYTIEVSCQDSTKWLDSFFISDKTVTDTPTTTSRYWISYIFGLVGVVSYSLDFDGDGVNISKDTEFGNNFALDELNKLCMMNGWFMYADNVGVIHIGNIVVEPENPKLSIHDTEILDISLTKDDSMLRNRVVVRGTGSTVTKKWVTAEVKKITPWNYDNLDYRSTCITDSYIPDTNSALVLANQLLKETEKITYVKTVRLAGFYDLMIGEVVYVSSKKYSGTCVVTSVDVTVSGTEGNITTLLLDERCPRLFGYIDYGGYVYVGTDGSGIWRKLLKYDHTWTNFSTGLTDLSITNLSIANGVYACTTENGHLYTRTIEDSQWNRFSVDSVLPYSGGMISSSPGLFISATVDRTDGTIYAGYNKHVGETISGIYYVDPEDRSWVAEINPGFGKQYTEITVSGLDSVQALDIDSNEDAAYLTTVGYNQGELPIPILVVNPEVSGSLNTIASVQGLGYTSSDLTTLPFHTQMYGQLSTTEFLDDSNIIRQNLPGGATANTALALYGSIMYCAQGDRVYRLDLNTGTNKGKVIPDIGYLGILQIDAIDNNHCSVLLANLSSHLMYEVNVDFTNIASPTSTQTNISIADYWKGGILAKYVVDTDFKHKLIITYQPDLPSGQYEHTSWPYVLYDCETLTYTTGNIAIPAFIGDDPSGWTYNATLVWVEGNRDIFSVPFLVQKSISKTGPEDRNLIAVMGFISPDGGVDIVDTIYNEIVIDGTTFTTFSIVKPRYTISGYVVGTYGFDLPSFNSNPATASWGYTNKQYPGGGVIYSINFIKGSSEETTANSYDFAQTINSFSKDHIFNYNYPTSYNVYNLNGAIQPAVDHTLPNPMTTLNYLISIDDLHGKFLCVRKIGTSGADSILGIFLDDETTRILPSFTITEATAYDNSARGIFLLGGIIMYRAPSNGMWSAIYSKTEAPGSGGGGTVVVTNQHLSLLEYQNQVLKYISEVRGQFVDTSKTYPVTVYGGDVGFNNGTIENYWKDTLSGYMESIFVSSYVSDARIFDYLSEEGISRVGLFGLNYPSPSGYYLMVTDYDNILTSGLNLGGVGIVGSGLYYTDIWKIHALSGWVTFSGIPEFVETTNYQDQPYFFVSLAGESNRFYQKDEATLTSIPTHFVEHSAGLPASKITIVRCDDSI